MMSATWFCVTVLLLKVSQCAARADVFHNGKLSSGRTYFGNSYQHILVEEAEESKSSSSHSNKGRWYAPGAESCFRLYKTRTRIDRRNVKRVSRTENRAACEAECSRIPACLGFNYRYRTDGANRYRDNCELSIEKASTAGEYAFYRDDDFDFYERIGGPHNIHCDNHDHWLTGSYHPGSNFGDSDHYYGGAPDFREECFRRAEEQARPYERAVRESVWTDSIYDCMEKCHHSYRYDCLSFSFGYLSGASRSEPNCLLSDREYRDFFRGDFIRDQDFDFFERRIYDRECGVDSADYGIGRSMTVKGERCYRGSCRQNREGEFLYWYCNLDDSGESWDFCCAPDEDCGYGEGSRESWCYVGTGEDSWRPCEIGINRSYLKEGEQRALLANSSSSEQEDEYITMNETSNVTSNVTSLWNNSSLEVHDLPDEDQ